MTASGVATESNPGAVAPPVAATATRKPWQFKPGQSGNPGGRMPGLRLLVRQQTGDGMEMVGLYVAVMRGERIVVPGRRQPLRPTLAQMLEAARELMDRGFGKPVQALEHTGADGEPIQHELRGALAVQAVDYRQAVVLRPPTVDMSAADLEHDALPSPAVPADEADHASG